MYLGKNVKRKQEFPRTEDMYFEIKWVKQMSHKIKNKNTEIPYHGEQRREKIGKESNRTQKIQGQENKEQKTIKKYGEQIQNFQNLFDTYQKNGKKRQHVFREKCKKKIGISQN